MTNHMRPHHFSMRHKKRKPRDYGVVKCTPDMVEFMERESLRVFSDMTMNGHTFIQAIAAIYLTGFNDALAAIEETSQ